MRIYRDALFIDNTKFRRSSYRYIILLFSRPII